MALQKTAYNLKDLCNQLDIPLELLKLVRNNKDYVAHHLLTSKPNKNISEVIDEFMIQLESWVIQKVLTERTKLNYCHFLNPFNTFIKDKYPETDISRLTIKIFNEYVSTCRSFKDASITNGTRNTYLKYVRKLLYFSLDMGYLFLKDGERHIKNKFHWGKSHRLPKYVPDEIVTEILKLTTLTREPYRNHTIICFLLGTGARVAEIINVKTKDINLDKNFIHLTGKNNKRRIVFLYPFLKKVLLSYMKLKKMTNSNEQFLFTAKYGGINKQMTESPIQKMIYKLFEKLGYSNMYSTHSFRHSYAVNCLKAGMKIEYIAELLGHENIETTMIYTKLLSEDLLEEVQKYPIPLEKVLFTIMGMEGNYENEVSP